MAEIDQKFPDDKEYPYCYDALILTRKKPSEENRREFLRRAKPAAGFGLTSVLRLDE